MTMENEPRPLALITGASSGIGAAFAERLAADGHDLILVARRRERLEALAERLRASTGVAVEVLAADLAAPDGLRVVEERIAAGPALDLLVNNAGFGAYMPFVELGPDRAEELIRLQVTAVTRLTHAALTGMLARGRGAIINVSSLLSVSGALNLPRLPKRATYAGTKAFSNTFTQLLSQELEGTGVQVQALLAGVVATEFHDRVGMDANRFPPEIVMRPEDLVAASLAGLRLGEVICVPGLDDPELLERLHEAQRQLFGTGRRNTAAARYNS
jgi:uncharacterized protein